jgi:predicted  nucleic acid-binding Zn-ribbon protein
LETKYKKLVFIKEQDRKNKEAQIAKINAKRAEVKQKIDNLNEAINETKIPKDGNFAALNIIKATLDGLRREKRELENYYNYLAVELTNAQKQYKKANIEYEKMKHLDDLEKEKMVEKIKKLEQIQSDEISLMLFNNKEL